MANRQDALAEALDTEQRVVSALYDRLDQARTRARATLRQVHGLGGASGSRQAMVEREVMASEQARRLAQLHAVERGLCFGRIDDRRAGPLYVGRIGLRDEEHESVLIDWRAPAARAFYVATATTPAPCCAAATCTPGTARWWALDDEVFDLAGLSDGDRRTLVGEAALLAALRRGGRAGWATWWPPSRPSRTG